MRNLQKKKNTFHIFSRMRRATLIKQRCANKQETRKNFFSNQQKTQDVVRDA